MSPGPIIQQMPAVAKPAGLPFSGTEATLQLAPQGKLQRLQRLLQPCSPCPAAAGHARTCPSAAAAGAATSVLQWLMETSSMTAPPVQLQLRMKGFHLQVCLHRMCAFFDDDPAEDGLQEPGSRQEPTSSVRIQYDVETLDKTMTADERLLEGEHLIGRLSHCLAAKALAAHACRTAHAC